MAGRGQLVFHTGALFFKDPATNGATIQCGTMQEVTFDFKASSKPVFGENQFAEAIGRGNTQITGKAKQARFNGKAMNQAFFNQPTANVGSTAYLLALDEEQTVASAAATATNAANYQEDLGVQYSATGIPMVRVASAPAVGQYTINESTGVYAFNATDNASKVKLTYLYKTTATGAGNIAINNQLAGEAPTFRAVFSQRFQSQTITLILNALVGDSLAFGFKLEEFAMPEYSFSAQADANGAVGLLSMTRFS